MRVVLWSYGFVAIGGALGAMARFGLNVLMQRDIAFPWGTLAANLLGCFVMGLVAHLVATSAWFNEAGELIGPATNPDNWQNWPIAMIPLALLGLDWRAFLAGARDMDGLTRARATYFNPAAQLARAWFEAGDGVGRRAMVVLPYADRLGLFGRYLQQLVMESLGKAHDRHSRAVQVRP